MELEEGEKQKGYSKMREEKEEEAEAEVEMWKYVFGFTNMAAVKCAYELGIADAIENHQGPIALSDLSSTLGCAPSSLYRIMRFLIHQKIFKEKSSSKGTTGYVHTPLSRRLLGRGEYSMAAFLLLESSPVMLAPWHFISARVQLNGTAAFEAAHGGDVWKYAAANPGHSKLIDDAMACNARNNVATIVERYPEVFDGINTLVDVGGGNGTTIGMLVKAFPWIQGINFDLPHVVSVAPEHNGVGHVGGDMFESVPKADAAFIMAKKVEIWERLIFGSTGRTSLFARWVLHNWSNDECVQILKKCKEAIAESNGKLIIAEVVVGETKDDKLEFVRLMLDMVTMAHTDKGQERTSKEWGYVLQEAGFRSHTIKFIGAVQCVIEAFP